MSLRRKIPRIPSSEYPFLEEVDFERLRMKLAGRALTQHATPTSAGTANDNSAADSFKAGFHHIVGIQNNLERLGMILSSSQANNVWITGPSGIGKTILVEALLRARAENRLTSQLSSKPFYLFDVNSFATATYGVNPVKELDKCLTAASARGGVLIIDHMADLMKMVGSELAATLSSTFAKHFEGSRDFQAIIVSESDKDKYVKDASAGLERQFQILDLSAEPDDVELKKILTAKINSLESVHNVNFSEEAVDEIIRLLSRYPGRAFTDARPQNAIKFADKVATFVRLNKYAEPIEITELREKIRLLQDQLSIVSDDEVKAEGQRKQLEAEIVRLTESYQQMDLAWKKKFEALFKVRASFENIDAKLHVLRNKSERTSIENQQFNIYASNYDDSKRKIEAEEKALYPKPPTVEPKHVRAIFSQESGVPASSLSENRLEHLAKLDEYLAGEIVRQAGPRQALSTAYFQRETGISDPSRPACIFLFLGGTGLGKTELAKALARFDAGDESGFINIRLSEFKGKEAGKRLTGADPGLVGYEDGSCLEGVRKNPRAIVLWDEAEKADPSVFDVLMQIPEEGKLTPSNSKTPLEFKDTLQILASNALKAKDFSKEELQDEAVIRERLKKVVNPDTGALQFKPEFLGRIDRVFVFEDLEPQDHVKIFRKEIRKINRDYAGRGISVAISDDVAAEILKLHDDPTVGGRLSRNICSKHIRPLITAYLKENIKQVMNEDVKFHAHLNLQFDGQNITLQISAPAVPATTPVPNFPTPAFG